MEQCDEVNGGIFASWYTLPVYASCGLFICLWLFDSQAEFVHARLSYRVHGGHHRLIGRILVGVDDDMWILVITHRFFDREFKGLESVIA